MKKLFFLAMLLPSFSVIGQLVEVSGGQLPEYRLRQLSSMAHVDLMSRPESFKKFYFKKTGYIKIYAPEKAQFYAFQSTDIDNLSQILKDKSTKDFKLYYLVDHTD